MEPFPVSDQELTEWTSDMVRIPSYAGIPGREAAVAAYIRDVFRREGVESWIDPLEDGRANVYGLLGGTAGGKSLMLNGHTDTVPPYDMPDACLPMLAGGRLHGRGSSDMKGPLASMMGALIAIKRSGRRLRGDLMFAGVADEEDGSLGCIDLMEKGYTADGAVVCEPLGSRNIGVAQKGLEWYQIDFEGRAVHGGSQDAGVNAIWQAVRFIDEVENRLRPALDARTHPFLGRSTVNVAVIRGGTQPSTVPGECTVQLDRRFLPDKESYEQTGAELAAILERLSAADPTFRAKLSVMPASSMRGAIVHQGFETDAAHPLVRACAESIESVTGEAAKMIGCPCWTDGGLLSHYAHIPTVVWGPGLIELCHSREEYIEVSELSRCACAYADLAKRFCR